MANVNEGGRAARQTILNGAVQSIGALDLLDQSNRVVRSAA